MGKLANWPHDDDAEFARADLDLAASCLALVEALWQFWRMTVTLRRFHVAGLALLFSAGVEMYSAVPVDSDYAALATSTAGDSEKLHELFRLSWRKEMEDRPERATYNGYPGLNDRWTDWSAAAVVRRKQRAGDPLAVLERIDRTKLGPADQLNFDLFRQDVIDAVEEGRFPTEVLPITQMEGIQQEAAQTLSIMPKSAVKDFEDAIARLRRLPPLIDQTIDLLKAGLTQGVTPPRVTLRDVAQQISNQIVANAEESPLFRTFREIPATVPTAEQARLRGEARDAIASGVLPAYRRLHEYFTQEYLPKTRESIAASALPNGQAWYELNIRLRTTTRLSAREIHEIGLAEVKRIRAEMDKIIADTGFRGSFAEFAKFLRTDSQFFFTRTEDLLAAYRDISKRADPELARLFGKLPRLPYGVLPVPSYAEKSQTTAYYQPGAASFGRAGYFFANTYDLPSRPKWEMEALTLHEAVPGHHLQIALAQELADVPDFRRHSLSTAFIEGWGLYSEKLGEEMGFYKDPYSKFGQLTYEMWRAIRLVVDTGMHALGWSREQAIEFFKANAAKSEHDIVVEVDRYIVWPGQALAYKIGELKIRELRARAERELGTRFDIRRFHDELLGQGALPLDILESRINDWIARERPSGKGAL